ncbi:hypothetical protein OPV22_006537 [Ensete ventricosum]|uniref:Reverse transcriptase domain-containing protein n=1 Tax=Ensete ventricosum TaxID=4639 RepID=A0AAV8RRY7_ENSVE|nr:hypothetical protein OPV22_006537 [Ensete ventricosum]
MVDTGSSADILYFDVFQKLGLTNKDLLPMVSTLTGFTGDSVSPAGTTILPVTIGGEPKSKTLLVSFIVVALPSAYNTILGRPTLNKPRVVVLTYHRIMKFPTRVGVREVRSDPPPPPPRKFRQCYLMVTMLPKKLKASAPTYDDEDSRKTSLKPEPAEKVVEVPLNPGIPNKTIKVGSMLPEEQWIQLIEFLRKKAYIFAWSPKDMSRIDPEVTQHHLNIEPTARPVKQQPRKFAPDQQKAIEREVARLLDVGLITEVKYPTWLSNVVLVKKSNGTWRMCIDYTSLNRACPKDCYPLPRIDLLVDATSGYELLSFMDSFLGYN